MVIGKPQLADNLIHLAPRGGSLLLIRETGKLTLVARLCPPSIGREFFGEFFETTLQALAGNFGVYFIAQCVAHL